MSLPWRDQLHIALGPTEVVHLRRQLGMGGARVDTGVVRVEPAADAPAWRAPLDGLAMLWPVLATRPASVRVVLSNRFVRYAVVPWREDLSSPTEREEFTRHCFRETYGDSADGWALRENPEPHGRPSLACAVDRELLDSLRALSRGTRLRLGAIQPLFMTAFNEYRRALGDTGCFLVYERGRLCGATYERGEWRSAMSARVDGEGLTGAAIEREIVLHGVAEDVPVFLCIVDESPAPDSFSRPVKLLAPRRRMHLDYAAARLRSTA